jgi:hypothetical protein
LQLTSLVWATTKHDLYLMGHHKLLHWSALTMNKEEVIDLQEYGPPPEVLYLFAKYLCNLNFFFLGLVHLVVKIQLYM